MPDPTETAAAAKHAAGNWQTFDHFVWWRQSELADAPHWTIFATHHRDSDLLEESNAAAFAKALEPFAAGDDPDAVFEAHSHWAVGQVHAVSVRVYRPDGTITPAFEALLALLEKREQYPVLDESDYSDRQTQATLDNYHSELGPLQTPLPDGWERQVRDWFDAHGQERFTEDHDDRGGWAPREAIVLALQELGLLPTAIVATPAPSPAERTAP